MIFNGDPSLRKIGYSFYPVRRRYVIVMHRVVVDFAASPYCRENANPVAHHKFAVRVDHFLCDPFHFLAANGINDERPFVHMRQFGPQVNREFGRSIETVSALNASDLRRKLRPIKSL
jgi:hypothetical protein